MCECKVGACSICGSQCDACVHEMELLHSMLCKGLEVETERRTALTKRGRVSKQHKELQVQW